jgi:hypothetical protein
MSNELVRSSIRGQRAQQIIDNPEWQDTIRDLKQQYFEGWCDAQEPDERERIWHTMRALKDLENSLSVRVMNGQVADFDLETSDG